MTANLSMKIAEEIDRFLLLFPCVRRWPSLLLWLSGQRERGRENSRNYYIVDLGGKIGKV